MDHLIHTAITNEMATSVVIVFGLLLGHIFRDRENAALLKAGKVRSFVRWKGGVCISYQDNRDTVSSTDAPKIEIEEGDEASL